MPPERPDGILGNLRFGWIISENRVVRISNKGRLGENFQLSPSCLLFFRA
jgi:hypothetical protein